MSLTWHIVRKDLRRMALPVGLWVAFGMTAMIWLGAMHMDEDAVRAGDFYRWISGVGGFTAWANVMQIVTAALLAAHLLQDDGCVGSEGFWLTRPIARGRMLVAKLIAGGLLLVLAPVVALTPVWLVNGFSAGEVAMAGGEFAVWQIVIVVIAFAIAALTKNLAQFFFAAAGVAVAFVLVVYGASQVWRWGFAESDVLRSRQMLTFVTPVLFLLAMLVWQYITRRTRTSWLAIGVGLPALFAVGVAWPFDVVSALPRARSRLRAAAMDAGEKKLGHIAVEKIVTPIDHARPYTVSMTVAGGLVGGVFFAPENYGAINLLLADKRRILLTISPGAYWGKDAAMRLAALRPDVAPVEWEMAGRTFGVHNWSALREAQHVSGTVHFALMHGSVLAELPLRAGAQARSGSSVIRIVGLSEGAGQSAPSVAVEERDTLFILDAGVNQGRQVRQNDTSRRDCYLLVNRALHTAASFSIIEIGSANMGSLIVSVRQLELPVPEWVVNGAREELPGWRESTTLLKVRFELEERIAVEVKAEHVALENEEEKK